MNLTYLKKVKYRNSLGQEVIFDNKIFFCERIDMTGTSGVHTSDTLAFSDGQITTNHQLSPKTIPCDFAFKDKNNDVWARLRLAEIFNPTINGILTVYSQDTIYKIDVYPQDFPTFTPDSTVPYVYRWSVDFIADYPYWRVGSEKTIELISAIFKFNSRCSVNIPVTIYFPANVSTPFNINGKGFTLRSCEVPLFVNTKDFSVKNADGINFNNKIDAETELDNIFLKFGENIIFCPQFTGVKLSYQNLSVGVF